MHFFLRPNPVQYFYSVFSIRIKDVKTLFARVFFSFILKVDAKKFITQVERAQISERMHFSWNFDHTKTIKKKIAAHKFWFYFKLNSRPDKDHTCDFWKIVATFALANEKIGWEIWWKVRETSTLQCNYL